MSTSEDAEIIDETDKTGWAHELKDATNGNGYTTVYDPIRCYTAWMTVPDSMWTEVER